MQACEAHFLPTMDKLQVAYRRGNIVLRSGRWAVQDKTGHWRTRPVDNLKLDSAAG
jgi:hypothetical protein